MVPRFGRTTIAAIGTLALTALAVSAPVVGAAPKSSLSTPVVGSVLGGGSFSGTMSITSFGVQNGQAVALGTVSGIVTTAAGIATSVVSTFAVPVQVGTTTCEILHLDLGPISLNLLGLQVDLSRVVLDITAQTGAGNLLGNLLCAVAGLLNDPGGLARLLNQILAVLIA